MLITPRWLRLIRRNHGRLECEECLITCFLAGGPLRGTRGAGCKFFSQILEIILFVLY